MATNPTLLAMPLAQNGQKNVIPETQATAGDGLFSQSTGFPAETSLPLGAGGVAPSREDFNGLANLLGGVAFMAQKGFTFNYDATQDYYESCIVIDPSDGLRYECIADMTAGTIAPHDDTLNDYWKPFESGANKDLSNLTQDGENHFLDQDFTIIYPNGGSEGSPANVAINSRYIETNPFAGYIVQCQAEVYYNSQWGAAEWFASWNGVNYLYASGVKATQLNDDTIIVQTAMGQEAGATSLLTFGTRSGSPFGEVVSSAGAALPCRVKVWKIGKIPA